MSRLASTARELRPVLNRLRSEHLPALRTLVADHPPVTTRRRARLSPATALGATALGAAALGALAIGALAIGALVVGRLTIRKARVRSLEVDELKVRSLRIDHMSSVARGAPDQSTIAAPEQSTVAGSTPSRESVVGA